MKKFVFLSAIVAAMAFAASNARAVMGTITLTGTATFQSADSHGKPVMKNQSLDQKNLLFILAQATGDASITNKPTQIFFDPDTFNTNAWNSVQGYFFYGAFYYSNSVSGLQALDGRDGSGNYYSYMEFDYYNPVFNFGTGASEGFFDSSTQQGDKVFSESDNLLNWSANGSAVLYVHSDPTMYNIMSDGHPSYFYDANVFNYAAQQAYSVIIQGAIGFKMSFTSNNSTETESFTIKGPGDLVWNQTGAVVNGTITFNGHGASEFK